MSKFCLCMYMVDILTGTAFYFFYFGSFFLVSFMFQLISAVLSSFSNFLIKCRFFADVIGKYLTTP